MGDTLGQFFNGVGSHKLLTREEEVQLSQRIGKGDKFARDKMVQANLRLAISIAKGYMNKGASFEDLVQEANVGLLRAVDLFDGTRGFKFSTYATWWIRQSVRRFVNQQASCVRMPVSANAFYHQARMMIQDYTKEFSFAPSDEEVADFMGVSLVKYLSLMNAYRSTVSLDSSAVPGDAEGPRLHETLEDTENPDPVEVMDHEKIVAIIRSALSTLTPREEKILRLRFGITEEASNSANFPITTDELTALNARGGV